MTPNQNIIYHDRFDSKGFTDENSLANALLTQPDKISGVITFLAGREENRFPLHFLTEGQKGGLVNTKEINDIQYEWSTFKRLRKGSEVFSSTYSSTDRPGIGNSTFTVIMKDSWLIEGYLAVSPNRTVVRVQSKVPILGDRYEYTFKLFAAAPTAYCDATELQAGKVWVMEGGAPVSESFSMGNKSNIVTPGKMKNQISILRKSYHLGGNVANKTVELKFNVNGKPTNYWIDFERWQHQLNWRYDCEEHYWYSKYNRNEFGQIMDKDPDTGLPIPTGAGIDDQIKNSSTYGQLTAKKIRNTVLDVTFGSGDAPMNIVLYTGTGGAEEFHNAMLEESGRYGQIIGDKFTTGVGSNLSLGAYYNRYLTPQGHVITVKIAHIFDYGSRAQNAPKHPITNLPLSSYDMYFVDQSMYEGEQNVVMVTQKGRAFIEGIEKGMAAIYTMNGMAGNNNNFVSTEQDKSSVHYMAAKGVLIRRNTHCFKLTCDLS
jgi:hypothetical protein